MAIPRLECVLNFSEGRDASLIDEIVSAVKSAKVLNLHSDPDHNRSVVTFVGNLEETKQGAFDLTQRAMRLLDIREHEGVHPFIGVVDVIPFIPLQNCAMSDAVAASHQLGRKLWSKLRLPVYYYGLAAKVKERKDLPYVRKGGYRTLQKEIDLPEKKPDVGQGLNASAGAVAVGAREILIAFNINFATNDLSLVQSIAKNIRERSGGLPGVRALGLALRSRGITQVSINLVDHKTTSLGQVFDEVKKWAKEYQAPIIESEIVGMIPTAAYQLGMETELKINNFNEALLL